MSYFAGFLRNFVTLRETLVHEESFTQRGQKILLFLSLCAAEGAVTNIATHPQIHYTFGVEYPFPPVGIVGAADGKNRRAFFFLEGLLSQRIERGCTPPHDYRRHRVTLTALLLIVSKVFASKSGGC